LTTLVKIQGLEAKVSKGKFIGMNFKNMATITSRLSLTFNVSDVFLLRRMNVNCERKNKVKINNLKMVKDLFVI
jgi:hypothetical protein